MIQIGILQSTGIALALAADCFAVSVSGGIRTETPAGTAVKFALYFGAAQAAMLLAGWFSGAWFRTFFFSFAEIAAFAFLALAGFRMIFDSFKEDREHKLEIEKPRVVLSLAFATSIDALAVGAGLSLVYRSIALTAVMAGAVAFLMSFAGVYAGDRTGRKLKKNAEIAGGAVLSLIGFRILLAGIF